MLGNLDRGCSTQPPEEEHRVHKGGGFVMRTPELAELVYAQGGQGQGQPHYHQEYDVLYVVVNCYVAEYLGVFRVREDLHAFITGMDRAR